MFQVILENILVAAVGLALLYYLGSGLCLWLPSRLAAYRWLVAPWAGYCLLVVVTQFLTNWPPTLTALQSAYVALGIATVLNLYATWRARQSKRANPPTPDPQPPTPDPLPIALISLAVFVLCVLPLWSYGYTTIIGENWDAEIYMGLGEYLKVYPQAHLTLAAPNPILDTLINPPYGLRTHGFSYFQAMLGVLPLDSLRTLAPALALLRALSIPATYVFFNAGMRLRRRASLLACAALGLNAFLLWVTYNMFGMQVPTFGLLPLLLCFTLVMLDSTGIGEAIAVALWTGLFAAAVAVTYHPALTAYVAMAGPVVLVALARHWRAAGWRIVGGLALAMVVGLALSLVSQLKSLDGFLKQYGEKTAGLGLTGFTSPGDALGFSLSFRDLLPTDPGRPLMSLLARLYDLVGWLALLVSLLLIAFYVYRLWANRDASRDLAWQQSALLAGAIAYTLLFIRPLDYPYGWFKALSFVSFVLIGAVVSGLSRTLDFDRLGKFKIHNSKFIIPLALLALMLITTVLTMRMYWGEPLRFNREMSEVGAVRDVIETSPGDSSVYMSNSPNMQRLGVLYNGLLSYFLRDTDLYGDFKTANSRLNRERPDGLYRYMLLHADDSPSEYGAGNATLAWHNSLMSLYAFPSQAERRDLYHHDYREDGKYPAVQAGQAVTISLSGGQPLISSDPAATLPVFITEPVQLTLGFAMFTTQTLVIQPVGVVGRPIVRIVPPGYTTSKSAPLRAEGPLLLWLDPGPAYIRWAHLETYSEGQDKGLALTSDGAGLLANVSAAREGDSVSISVDYLNNRPQALSQTLSLDIYGEGRGNSIHYGYWNFQAPFATPLRLKLGFDPVRKSVVIREGAVRQTASSAGNTGDGSYTASLLVYENGQVSETFNDIFKFEIKGGKLASFTPRSQPPQFR